jgi:hypothetical protein
MTQNFPASLDALGRPAVADRRDLAEAPTASSGVSWGAIFAGAAGAAALSLILLILGTGLGLSSVSPWAGQGASATTFGASTIVWITLTQLLASGMGGYLAGRLRTKWAAVHTDEVYFRDTAHGFLAWAVATLVTAAVLTSTISSIVSTGAQGAGMLAGGAATAATAAAGGAAKAASGDATGSSMMSSSGPMGYAVDSLFRKDPTATTASATPTTGSAPAPTGADTATSNAEVTRIMANSISGGPLPADDSRYLGQLVAQRTGLSQQDAEKRVSDTYAKLQAKARDAETAVREAADKARKASAYAALWLFVSLLVGAFVASLMATYGGRRRDLF